MTSSPRLRARIRSAAAIAFVVVSILGHLTGGLRADASQLFVFAFVFGGATAGSGPGEMRYPVGMAVGPQDRVYVADTQNDRVQIFEADGTFVASFGSTGDGNGQFSGPSGIAVDPAGNILVADNFNHRLQLFDASLAYVRSFGSFGNYDTLDPANLDPITGNYSGPTPTLTGLNYPTRVALRPGTVLGVPSASGRVVITDSQNHRVIVLDSELSPLFTFGAAGVDGNGPGEFDYPWGIGIDLDHIYVSDPSNHQIQIFDQNGNFQTAFGSIGTEHSAGDLGEPHDVQPAGDGRLIIADRDRSRVLFLTPDPLADRSILCSSINAAAAAGRCTIVAADKTTVFDALVIGGFTGSGQELGKFTRPQAVAMDSLGRLLVLDTEGHRVVVFRAAHIGVSGVSLDTGGPLQSGQSVTLDVTIVNDGAAALTVSPLVAPSLQGSLTIPDGRFMEIGATETFRVTFVTDASGVLNFTVRASGLPTIGRAIVSAPVVAGPITVNPAPGPKMSLSMPPAVSPVGIGNEVRVDVIVSNNGTSTLTAIAPSVEVTPGLVTFISSVPSGVGPLGPGATRTFTFKYTALAAGTATFTARATATYEDLTAEGGVGSIETAAALRPTASVTITTDAQAPATTLVSVSPDPADTGWYLGPVTVVLQAVDNIAVKTLNYSVGGDTVQPFSGQAMGPAATVTTTFSITHDGGPQLDYYAEDTAQNVEATHSITFRIDSIAPTLAKGGVLPAPNGAGWNNTAPIVKFNASDAGSGVAFVTPPVTVQGEGALIAVAGTARDVAGNSAQTVTTVNVDKHAPALVCAPTVAPTGLNGWFKQGTGTVTVRCDAVDQDGLSGLLTLSAVCPTNIGTTTPALTATPTFTKGPLQASASCTISAEGVFSAHGEATDVAGNAIATQPITIKIDRTAPTVTCGTASGGEIWPPNHQMVPWNVFVNVVDPVSGSAGFTLVAYTSSEAANALADGNTDVDMTGWLLGTPDVSGSVRSERSGKDTGRVYQLKYVGADLAGNVTSCTSVLTEVPHDQGKK
jgi:hypothetical protein